MFECEQPPELHNIRILLRLYTAMETKLLTDELEVLTGVDVHDILNLVSCPVWASKITIQNNRNQH